ncbi:hypothetical protein JCM17823_06340 [Halorubrum gandharaense]
MSDTPSRNQPERAADADIHQLLSSSRRRRTIWCLAIADTWEMPLRHVASHVAAFEQEESATQLPRSEATAMYHSLKRDHTGPLVSLDVITVGDQEMISPGLRFFEILPLLARTKVLEHDR